MRFTHSEHPQRLYFGTGTAAADVAEEVATLGASRLLLISENAVAGFAEAIAAGLPVVARISEVVQHVPLDRAEQARALAAQQEVDAVISVGGGSAVGLAKAIALTTGLPIVAVPSTYAGSEATVAWGITAQNRKETGVDPRVLPAAVVADPELTAGLPLPLSMASGLNAAAHAVDSFWAPNADPVNASTAAEGLRAMVAGLRALRRDEAATGREQCLLGAYLCAKAFSSAGSGLHHKICHVLGGAYDMPHAPTHAAVLPYVLAFNAGHAPDAVRRVAAALDRPTHSTSGATTGEVVAAWSDLVAELGVTTALRDVAEAGGASLTEAGLDEAARLVLPVVPASNPRPVGEAEMRAILRAAWAADDPASLLTTSE